MIQKPKEWISKCFKNVTIEPMIFLFVMGMAILNGAQIPTNILIVKICNYELNYTAEICDNLSEDWNKDFQDDIQIRVNNFIVKAQWISSAPRIIFALYGGPFSDKMGRKPILLIPIMGFIFTAISGIINYAFIETLPLEFFYLETISSFFGGLDLYYLGIYSYGTSVTTAKNRAYRISFLDGVETIAVLTGTLLSSLIFENIGFYGNYSICGGFIVLAATYLKLFVKEPIKRKKTNNTDGESNKRKGDIVFSILVKPMIDIWNFITAERSRILTFLIAFQLFVYCSYIIVYNSSTLLFLFMLDKFTGFSPSDFAFFTVAMSLGNAFFLIVAMPIVSGKYQVDDALLLTIICAIETLSFTVSPFVTSLPAFYAVQLISSVGYCKYAISRSLLAKCCEPKDNGKLFSLQSVLISVTFMVGNPIVRELYNSTLKTFPGAFLLLSASLLVVAGFANLFMYSKRDVMKKVNEQDLDEETKDKIDYAGADSTLFMTYL